MNLFLIVIISIAHGSLCRLAVEKAVDGVEFSDPSIYRDKSCPCSGELCTIDFSTVPCGMTVNNITITANTFILPTNSKCSLMPLFIFQKTSNVYNVTGGYVTLTSLAGSYININQFNLDTDTSFIHFKDINDGTFIISQINLMNETKSTLYVDNSQVTFDKVAEDITLNISKSEIHFPSSDTYIHNNIHLYRSILFITGNLYLEKTNFTLTYDETTQWSEIYVDRDIYIDQFKLDLKVINNCISNTSKCYQEQCAPLITVTPGSDIILEDPDNSMNCTVEGDDGMDELKLTVKARSIDVCFTRIDKCSLTDRYGYTFLCILLIIFSMVFLLIPMVIWSGKCSCKHKDLYL